MANNVGYLKAENNTSADDKYTPFYAVEPIVKYIKQGSKIWCPFDQEWSAYSVLLKEKGFEVITSHLEEGKDFFEYEPDDYDVIISNPPFSKKDQVLKRLYELGKPFAVLLPMNSLQGKSRCKLFVSGIQLLTFDARIGFHNVDSMDKPIEGSPFASAYFCKDFLPKDLIVEILEKYDRKLI